jgi:GT2 family glycosyltransferase
MVNNRVSLAVVLVNYNGLQDTLECIPTVLKSGISPELVIVVDNGSKEDDAAKIREAFPGITVLRSDANTGWSGGNNIGAWHAISLGAQWIFLLNNDTVLLEGWLESLLRVIETDLWDIFGPLINEYSQSHVIQTEGVAFNRKNSKDFFERVSVDKSSPEVHVTPCDIVNGCAVLFRSSLFEKLKGIDDRFFLVCEESDFCLRGLDEGARVGVMNRSLVLHKHSVSFARAGKPLQRYYATRNLGLLLSKHKTGGQRSGPARTWFRFLLFCHHISSHERELGNVAGAKAVAEGLADFIVKRFGPKPPKRSFLSLGIDQFFYLTHLASKFK